MARRRYISTKISIDKAVNKLAMECGDFAALLYTWLIPHAEDDCTLPSDPEEILMTVMPGRRDKTVEDVASAIDAIVNTGLLEYNEDGVLCFKASSFYEYQTYIQSGKRKAQNTEEKSPRTDNAAKRRKTPQNTSSFSPSFSPSPSPSFSLRENTEEAGTTHKQTQDKFVKPTLEEVTVYCKERRNGINPAKFLAHYDTIGWIVGGVHMQDRKAAIRKWECNDYEKKFDKDDDGGVDIDSIFNKAVAVGLSGQIKSGDEKGVP